MRSVAANIIRIKSPVSSLFLFLSSSDDNGNNFTQLMYTLNVSVLSIGVCLQDPPPGRSLLEPLFDRSWGRSKNRYRNEE